MDSDNDSTMATDSSHGTADETIVAEQVSEPEQSEIEKRGPGRPPKLKEGIQPCSFTDESCDGLFDTRSCSGPPPPQIYQYPIPFLSFAICLSFLRETPTRSSEWWNSAQIRNDWYPVTRVVHPRTTLGGDG